MDGTRDVDLHLIGKLHHGANLRYLYTGPQKPRGHRKQYAGKVVFTDLAGFEFVQHIGHQTLYTAVVNSPTLKRNLRIVYVCKPKNDQLLTAVLFSTNLTLSAIAIYRYYTARFQIEFLFRDAKQFTGLADCQARSKERLHVHVNASMTVLINLLKRGDRHQHEHDTEHVLSIQSWTIRKFNEHQLARFTTMVDVDLTSITSLPLYEELINYGVIAA